LKNLGVFKKAYDEELENAANWFHFSAAALLLDTLEQFGPLDSFAENRRYKIMLLQKHFVTPRVGTTPNLKL
jgi:hypothetical protein